MFSEHKRTSQFFPQSQIADSTWGASVPRSLNPDLSAREAFNRDCLRLAFDSLSLDSRCLCECSFESIWLPNYQEKRNLYTNKVHIPSFVPECNCFSERESGSVSSLGSRSSIGSASSRSDDFPEPAPVFAQHDSESFNDSSTQKSPYTVNLGTTARPATEPLYRECAKHILLTLCVKEYPEDFCSTFYKRNSHGYMFIRESLTSLKVNSTGPKQWVTIKVKLNENLTKMKVDVKRFPVWKPISLNQPAPRRRRRSWRA